jgi:hypothetical protein
MLIDRSGAFHGGGGSAAPAADHLAEIARLDVEIAKLQGRQMVHMAAHVAAVSSSDGWRYTSDAIKSAYAEISLMLNEAGSYADNRIGNAMALAADCPRTLAKVCAGELTVYRALVIHSQLSGLDGEEHASAEADALEAAPGLTPSKLRKKVQRIVAGIDPAAVAKRREAELKKRRIGVRPVADGMAYFSAYLSAEDAHGIVGLADEIAQTAKTPGDERTADERRADAFVDVVLRPNGKERVSYEAQVLVPVGTALGLNDEPGYLPGHGPIPADLCRRLAADATWRRIVTDPVTNTTLDIAPRRYRPGKRLSRFIHFRDKTCRWPGCNRTRVETDHTIRREHGGLTIRVNLGDFCKYHHDVKDLPGWKVRQDHDGNFTVITPNRRVYRTRPPGADGDVSPVETITIPGPPPAPARRKVLPPEDDLLPF